MRKFLLGLGIVGIVLGLVSLFWNNSGPAFAKFASKEGKFAILMPDAPEKKTKIVKGVTQITYGTSVNNLVYSVSYSDLPTSSSYKLADSVKAIVKAFGGKVVNDAPLTFAHTKGRQFEAQITKPAGHLSCRLAIVNSRYYMIMVMGNDARLTNSDVQTFLNSFKWLN